MEGTVPGTSPQDCSELGQYWPVGDSCRSSCCVWGWACAIVGAPDPIPKICQEAPATLSVVVRLLVAYIDHICSHCAGKIHRHMHWVYKYFKRDSTHMYTNTLSLHYKHTVVQHLYCSRHLQLVLFFNFFLRSNTGP